MSRSRNPIGHMRVEASVLSNDLRNVVALFVMLGLFATACTEESRDKIREALPSGVSGLPSGRPTGPTGGGSGATAPTGSTEPGETTAPTGSTGPVETPTEEPTEPPTESPAAPTEAPAPPEQGRLILAIIAILERLGGQPPPTEQPSPTETPSPEATTGPEGETATGPTGRSTGVTGAATAPTGPTGRTGATGSADGDASADVVQAAASSTTESPAWVLLLFLAVLGGVIGYVWWRARRGRAHHG
jgi:hypothetical protein